MKVGQQIQFRMDQLGVSVPELARRIGVSAQAIRFWLTGRSFPGKRHAPALEKALSFTVDYTEGAAKSAGRENASELMNKFDLEIALKVAQLTPTMKIALKALVDECLSLQSSGRTSLLEKERAAPAKTFFEGRQQIAKRSAKRAAG